MTKRLKLWGDARPAPTAVPGTMNQNKSCHL